MNITDPQLLFNIVQYKVEDLNGRINSFFSFLEKLNQ